MRTLIDGSCLLAARPTGVTVAVRRMLAEGRFPIDGDAEIVSYGTRPPDDARRGGLPYPWRHIRLPSKLVHALGIARASSLDRLFGPADRLLLPNLNIVGIPRIPFDLLIHDLSFLVHPGWFSRKSQLWHLAARPERLIRAAERVFAVSEWTKREIEALLGIPAERVTVLPIPLAAPVRTEAPRPLAEPYFLLFSAHDERKNAAVAERAFAAFAVEHPGWKLVLVGKTGRPKHPGIAHLPYVTNDEHTRWLQHAAALLYPSWYEGYGLPPQEAEALGVPTLASGVGVIGTTAGASATLLPPHLPHFWTEAMARIAAATSGPCP